MREILIGAALVFVVMSACRLYTMLAEDFGLPMWCRIHNTWESK